MSWRRLRSLLAPLLAMLLVLTSVVSVSAAAPPQAPAESQLIPLLQDYGLVKGDQFGNLNLLSPITRAEAATIFVRAVGQERAAQLVSSVSSFPDTNGHWAAGYITTAFRLGQMKGRDTGLFDPDARITNAEVLTVLLRIVKQEPTGIWTPIRAVQAARDLGIYSEGAPEVTANLEAIRGSMFRALARAITTIPLEDGRTVLATYTDKEAPQLAMSELPATTALEKITVSGSAQGAAYVLVNGQKVTLSNNSFNTQVDLAPGDNPIKVEAYDWAGNFSAYNATISRATDAAKIDVTGELSVLAGRTTTLNVAAFDAKGIRLPASTVTAKVTGNVGTFDAKSGVFSAGNTPGKATITFTAGKITKNVEIEVLGLSQEATSLTFASSMVTTLNKPATVTVQVLDRNGKLVTWDSGRPVTLSATTLNGLQISPSNVALTNRGVATFTVTGSFEGNTTLSAASPGLSPTTGLMQFTSTTRVVLTATPNSSVADGSTPIYIRALLQDENGNTVSNNTGRDIIVRLSLSGQTYAGLTSNMAIIRPGASSSAGLDGLVLPGLQTESFTVSGTLTSAHTFSVLPVSASFVRSATGTPSRLDLSAGSEFSPNTDVTLSVSVRDSNGSVVSTGSYAFKVIVTTNNGEPVTNGLPAGLSLKLGNTSPALIPVQGATGTYAVIGRTTNGFANLTLRYNKSGNVTVKLVADAGVGGAYDSSGALGAATTSGGFTMGERTITFAGAASDVQAKIDLPNLNLTDQTHGLLPATGSAGAKLKLYVVDASGGRVSVGGTATLTKTGASTTPLVSTATVVNGVAEFPIVSTTTAGTDIYTLTYNGLSGKSATVQVSTATASFQTKPTILSIYGQGGPTTTTNRVTLSDTHMVIQLPNYGSGVRGVVKVYRVSTNSLVYSSGVMELNGGPFIQIPRENLVATSSTYGLSDGFYVRINTGYDDSVASDRFPAPPANVIVEAPLSTNIYQVRYNAATKTLTAYASGITSGGVIDTSKMSFQVNGTTATLPTFGTTCTPLNGYFTCADVNIAPVDGTVTLMAAAGWYRYDPYGQVAIADTTVIDNVIQPLAFIKSATVSFKSNNDAEVTLYGSNLNSGTIYPYFLSVGGPLGNSGQGFNAGAGNAVTFLVPASLAAGLAPGGVITAAQGWFANGSDLAPAIANIPVFKSFQVNSAGYDTYTNTLTIQGSGFDGGTLKPENLYVVKVDGTPAVAALAIAPTTTITYAADKITLVLDDAIATTLESTGGTLFLASQTTSGSVFWFTNGGWNAKELSERVYPITFTSSAP